MSFVAVFAMVLLHVVEWGAILLVAGVAGNVFVRRVTFASLLERLVFTIALGLGLCATAIAILGHLDLLRADVLLALTAVGTVEGIRLIVRVVRSEDVRAFARNLAFLPRWTWLVVAACAAWWSVLLLMTQYPPLEYDGISHHLVLARYFLADHTLQAYPGVAHPIMLALHHMLFVWGMAIGDDVTAQMIPHAFLLLGAGGLVAWFQRQHRPHAAALAAAFWLGSPVLIWLAEAAYVDLAITCYALLGIFALRVFRDEGDARWCYLAAAMLAMAASVKLPGLFLFGIALVVVIVKLFRSERRLRTFATAAVIALAIALPFYGFIARETRNPFWPIVPQWATGIYGSPDVVTRSHAIYSLTGEPRTVVNFLLLPLDLVRRPLVFQADEGLTYFPLLMLWPIAWIVCWRNREVRWLGLLVVVLTIFWFRGPHTMRYWLPALPFIIVICASCLDDLLARMSNRVVRLSLSVAITIIAVLWPGRHIAGRIARERRPPVTAAERHEFLLNNLGGMRAVNFINARAKENEAVYVINSGWLNYYLAPRVIDYVGILQQATWPAFRWPDDREWVARLDAENVRWILIGKASVPEVLHLPPEDRVAAAFGPMYRLTYEDTLSYVFQRTSVVADASSWTGFHDITNCTAIFGWAWNPRRPTQRLEIDIYDNGSWFATARADQFRRDLLDNRIGDGRHGFMIPAPPFVKDGRPHSIEMRFRGTNEKLQFTPKVLECAP